MTSSRVFADSNLDPRFRAGLVGHWIGGGAGLTWFDRSGYGNHGALTNGPEWVLGHNGTPAISIDGSDDYVTVPHSSNFDDLQAMTVSLWFKGSDTSGGLFSKIFNEASSPGWSIYFASGLLICLAQQDATKYQYYTASNAAFVDGVWHHFAWIKSSNSSSAFYLDGIPKTFSNGSSGVVATLANSLGLNMGFSPAAGKWAGVIDDARIYNRVLSSAEIVTLANPAYSPIIGGGLICGL